MLSSRSPQTSRLPAPPCTTSAGAFLVSHYGQLTTYSPTQFTTTTEEDTERNSLDVLYDTLSGVCRRLEVTAVPRMFLMRVARLPSLLFGETLDVWTKLGSLGLREDDLVELRELLDERRRMKGLEVVLSGTLATECLLGTCRPVPLCGACWR